MFIGILEDTRTPEKDNKLPEIEIDSNGNINLEDFDLDSMGDIFYGDNM